MVLRRVLILFVFLFASATMAQVDWGVEQWVEESGDEETAAELNDLLIELQRHPLNLNDTVAVKKMPLLTPFQIRALCNYIILYGQLQSTRELYFIPGFDSSTMMWLEPLTVAKPFEEPHRWRLSDARHTLVSAMGGALERAVGYDSGRYEGDRLRALGVYSFNLYDKLSVRLVAEKDPTEAWGKQNYYSYHLMLNDVGRVERLVLGRYNLQYGQGLTLWTGLRPFSSIGGSTMRFGSGIRQAATFYEEDYQEGLAAKIGVSPHLYVSGFFSKVQGERLSGTHVDYRKGNLLLGITAAWVALDSIPAVREYAYNQNRFRGDRQFTMGLDWAWQWRSMVVYGEASLGENGSPAAVGGVRIGVGDAGKIGLSGRYFHPQYYNLHAQPYAIGSLQGEQGCTLEAESRLPLGFVVVGNLDLHRFSTLRYGSYAPSSGAWLRMRLQRQWGSRWSTALRYTMRLKERNIPNLDSTLYLDEESLREQWVAEANYGEGVWRFGGRAEYVDFSSESGIEQRGYLLGMLARYSNKALQATFGAALFDVDGYYARIYYNESNLQYAWSIPSLNGQGIRSYLLLRYSFGTKLTLAAKYTLMYMPGMESIGSGDAETSGPVRQSMMLYLRWHF